MDNIGCYNASNKPMNKKSRIWSLYTESRRWCEYGYKTIFEWSCEGSLKSIMRVGAYGNPVRYQ